MRDNALIREHKTRRRAISLEDTVCCVPEFKVVRALVLL